MFPYCWGGGGKGEKNAQHGNVKCKTENDWITNTGHISEIKACIPSATSLNLEGGSSSKSEWASVARRDSIVLQYISSFQKKQCEQKRNHKFCSGLQIFKITLWKPGDAKERAKAVFRTLEARARILAAWFGLSAVKSVWGVVCLHTTTCTGKWWWGLRQQRQIFGELTWDANSQAADSSRISISWCLDQGWILSGRNVFCEAQVTRSCAELLADVQYPAVEGHSQWFLTASSS